jgi:hypothetical protein
MKRYLLGVRLVWWNKGMDDLLSFFFLWPITIPLILVVSTGLSIRYTYLFLKKSSSIHSYYWDLIDRRGLYRCHLHGTQFRGDCPHELI